MSVVMVVFGGWELTTKALAALREHTEIPFELVVVDNPSHEDTAGRLASRARSDTRAEPAERRFRTCGQPGCRPGPRSVLVFLNADTVVQPGWLPPLLEAVEQDPAAGAAVPMMLGPDGSLQEAGGMVFGDGRTLMYGFGEDPATPVPLPPVRRLWVGGVPPHGAVHLPLLGGFDPSYVPAYCEDVDLQFSLRARGLRTVYQPRSRVGHVRFGSAASAPARRRMSVRNTRILRERWAEALASRPPLGSPLPPAGGCPRRRCL